MHQGLSLVGLPFPSDALVTLRVAIGLLRACCQDSSFQPCCSLPVGWRVGGRWRSRTPTRKDTLAFDTSCRPAQQHLPRPECTYTTTHLSVNARSLHESSGQYAYKESNLVRPVKSRVPHHLGVRRLWLGLAKVAIALEPPPVISSEGVPRDHRVPTFNSQPYSLRESNPHPMGVGHSLCR